MKKTSAAILLTLFTLIFAFSFTISVFASESTEVKSDAGAAASEIDKQNTPFGALYEAFIDNADKIFSALSFLGSIVVVLAYKRGLIPVLNSGLRSISKSSDELKRKSEEGIISAENALNTLSTRLAGYENSAEALSKTVEELTERLESREQSNKRESDLKEVLLAEIDMLYEIFINSSLPQYSKDALSERIMKMKKSLYCGDGNEN
ncbi:MAG: hypothetical protein IKV16_01015 [Clostridia bacterium]|nr:hypothetical protein [Clostridia bacterium]